jgi:hypothetical protein
LINPLASSDVQAFISPYWPNSLFIKSLSDSIPSSVSDTVSMLPLPFHLLFFCVLRKSLYYALPSRNCPSWNNTVPVSKLFSSIAAIYQGVFL